MRGNELELYLRRLKELQAKFADEKLTNPSDPTAFGFGQASGELRGLKRAEELLVTVIEEVANDENE